MKNVVNVYQKPEIPETNPLPEKPKSPEVVPLVPEQPQIPQHPEITPGREPATNPTEVPIPKMIQIYSISSTIKSRFI